MSAQTDRATTEFDYRINMYRSAQEHLAQLTNRANNPICGKPGMGYKAARKLHPTIATWQKIVATERDNVQRWVTRNGKASADERAKRLARVIASIPDFS